MFGWFCTSSCNIWFQILELDMTWTCSRLVRLICSPYRVIHIIQIHRFVCFCWRGRSVLMPVITGWRTFICLSFCWAARGWMLTQSPLNRPLSSFVLMQKSWLGRCTGFLSSESQSSISERTGSEDESLLDEMFCWSCSELNIGVLLIAYCSLYTAHCLLVLH